MSIPRPLGNCRVKLVLAGKVPFTWEFFPSVPRKGDWVSSNLVGGPKCIYRVVGVLWEEGADAEVFLRPLRFWEGLP